MRPSLIVYMWVAMVDVEDTMAVVVNLLDNIAAIILAVVWGLVVAYSSWAVLPPLVFAIWNCQLEASNCRLLWRMVVMRLQHRPMEWRLKKMHRRLTCSHLVFVLQRQTGHRHFVVLHFVLRQQTGLLKRKRPRSTATFDCWSFANVSGKGFVLTPAVMFMSCDCALPLFPLHCLLRWWIYGRSVWLEGHQ